MLKRIILTIGTACALCTAAQAQETMELNLQQTIRHAQQQSPDAQSARHSFRSSYWNYRYYRANYLPNLTLTSSPYLDRAINKVTMGDGSVKFVEQNLLSTNLTLSLTQNVPWTGGTFFVERRRSASTCSATTAIRIRPRPSTSATRSRSSAITR